MCRVGPVQWETLAGTSDEIVELIDDLATRGVRWARFGNSVFAYDPASVPITDTIHLVVQKGRSFQLSHPEIEVLLDKGRFLVVSIDRRRAENLFDANGDFAVEPLGTGRVVYEALPAAAGARVRRANPPLGAVDVESFIANMTHLTSLHTRLSTSALFRQAADWAAQRLTAAGYAVTLPEFPVGAAGTSVNVAARKFGVAAERGEVIVTAHLDSINSADGPDAAAPGADDNASGSCGALELASLLGSRDTDHDVTILLFGGEEQGLYGSRAHVAALSAPERERIRAVINMDMIGRINTEPPTVLLEGAPLSQGLIDRLAAAAAGYTSLTVETSLSPYASDHVPFIEAGIPAVLAIEGGDGANDAVHTARDTADRVTPEFAADIVTVVGVVVGDLAGLHPSPLPEDELP